jgi:hypothetical protein
MVERSGGILRSNMNCDTFAPGGTR